MSRRARAFERRRRRRRDANNDNDIDIDGDSDVDDEGDDERAAMRARYLESMRQRYLPGRFDWNLLLILFLYLNSLIH